MKTPVLLAGLAALFGLAGEAAAQRGDPAYREHALSGDWGGMRTDWHGRGVSTEFVWKADLLRDIGGGLKRGSAFIGNLDLKLGFDFDRLYGWSGTSGFLHVLNHQGQSFNREHVGSLLGVSNIEVAERATRIFHAWVQRTGFDERLAGLVGLYPIDSEFQTLESASVFVQPPYGPTADLALTRGPSIFNTSAFGARLRLLSADRAAYGLAAVLDGVAGAPDKPRGTHVRFDHGDGIMWITEIGYRPYERWDRVDTVGPEGLPRTPEYRQHERIEGVSKYAGGFWRYSGRVPDLVDTDADGNALRRKSRGWYALAEQTLWRERDDPAQGLSAFYRYGATDGDSTPIKYAWNAGFSYRGLIPTRDLDLFGVGFTRARIGHKFQAAFAAQGGAAADEERALELTYRIQFAKWGALQPVVQRYRNPGGDASVPSATVVGARIELVL